MLRKLFLLNLMLSGALMLTLGGVTSAVAQEEKKISFDVAALPKTADTVEKFVQKGWKLETTITGDLNNDTIPDAAVIFYAEETGERLLLALFKTKDGMFEPVATGKNVLQCRDCGGALYGSGAAPADIEISKGVMIVKEDFGSRETTDLTFRFRYDEKVKKMALIGFDSVDTDRATGAKTTASTNYLTGVRLTEDFQYKVKIDKYVKNSSRQSKVSEKTKYLEDVDYSVMAGD